MSRVAENAAVTILEGVVPDHLHPLQHSWIYHGAAQCGFCTLASSFRPRPCLIPIPIPAAKTCATGSRNHNVCRCTGYKPPVDAVMDAAALMRGDKTLDDVTFKMPADGRIWGSTMPRPLPLPR